MSFDAGKIKGALELDKSQYTRALSESVGEATVATGKMRDQFGRFSKDATVAPVAQDVKKLTQEVSQATSGVGRFAGALGRIQSASQPLALLPGPIGAIAGRVSSAAGMLDKFTGGLGSVGEAAGAASGEVAGAAGSVGGLAAAAGPAAIAIGAVTAAAYVAVKGVGFLWETLNKTTDAADNLRDTAQSVGVNLEWLDGMGKAAKLSGSDLGMVAEMAKFLSKNVAQAAAGNKEAQATFKALGIDIRDAGGHVKKTEDLMMEAIDAVGGLEDGALKTAAALKLFGRSGNEALSFINEGSGKINDYIATLRKLGGVTTEEQAKASDAWNDARTALGAAWDAIQIKLSEPIRTSLLPLLENAVKWVGDHGQEIKSWATSVGQSVVAGFEAGSKAIKPFLDWLQSARGELSAAMDLGRSLKAVLDQAFGEGATGRLGQFLQMLSPLNVMLKAASVYADVIAAAMKGLASVLDTIRKGIEAVQIMMVRDNAGYAKLQQDRINAEAKQFRDANKPKADAQDKGKKTSDESAGTILDDGTGAVGAGGGPDAAKQSADRARQLQVETQIAKLRMAGRGAEADLLALRAKYEDRVSRAPEGKAGDAERAAAGASFEQDRAGLIAKQQADAHKATADALEKSIDAATKARIEQLKAAGDELGADLLERGQQMKKDLAANRTAADPANDRNVELDAKLLEDQGKTDEAQQMRDRAATRKAIEEAYQADVAAIRTKYADKAKKDAEEEAKKKKARDQEQLDAQAELAASLLEEEGRKGEADLVRFDAQWKKKIASAEDAQTKITLAATYESERRQKIHEQEAKAQEDRNRKLAAMTEGLQGLGGGQRTDASAALAAFAAATAGPALPPGAPRPTNNAPVPPPANAAGQPGAPGQGPASSPTPAEDKQISAIKFLSETVTQLKLKIDSIARDVAQPKFNVVKLGGTA